MGAGVEFRIASPLRTRTGSSRAVPLTINIFAFKNGQEVFGITIDAECKDSLDLQVLQVLPREQHLVLVGQGEWFFIPSPNLTVADYRIRRNEPIRRAGGGKAHCAEFAFRSGGEIVKVCDKYPNGVTWLSSQS
jgi:hypothetical protein